MLQFVDLLFQPVIKLLHHHQAFIGSDATLSSHAESQKHTFYSEMLHTDLECMYNCMYLLQFINGDPADSNILMIYHALLRVNTFEITAYFCKLT